ncbi:hypothetical protein IWZ03DRAFT_230337 [Phyllosticta citriasiana]|uniref:Uncharacterized protein n=1 Tax=Phyllosticta citriasiana TaxID=595635 RepID=A0ABR1KMH5_9PEZI
MDRWTMGGRRREEKDFFSLVFSLSFFPCPSFVLPTSVLPEFWSGCPLRLTSLSVCPPRLLLFQGRIRKGVRAAQDETGPQKEDTETVGGSGSSKTQRRRRRGLERLNSLLTDGGRQSVEKVETLASAPATAQMKTQCGRAVLAKTCRVHQKLLESIPFPDGRKRYSRARGERKRLMSSPYPSVLTPAGGTEEGKGPVDQFCRRKTAVMRILRAF